MSSQNKPFVSSALNFLHQSALAQADMAELEVRLLASGYIKTVRTVGKNPHDRPDGVKLIDGSFERGDGSIGWSTDPGEHQEVLDAIDAHNSGEDE